MKVPTVAHIVLALPLAVWAMSCGSACEEGKESKADRKSTLRYVLTQENKGDQARRLSHEERAALHRGLRRAILEANVHKAREPDSAGKIPAR